MFYIKNGILKVIRSFMIDLCLKNKQKSGCSRSAEGKAVDQCCQNGVSQLK